MGVIYDHIDFYSEFKIEKTTYRIKKFTLRMFLNFWVNYRSWILTHSQEAAEEIIKDCVIIDKRKVQEGHRTALFEYLKSKITTKIEVTKEDPKTPIKKNPEDWLAETISFFLFYCGQDKETTLNLFYDEIQSLIAGIRKLAEAQETDRQDRLFLSAYYADKKPDKYIEEVIQKRQNQYADKIGEFETLRKLNKTFLAKSYGGEHAEQ
jgi:hypothetical protein